MTVGPRSTRDGGRAGSAHQAVCCALAYDSPLVELLVGDSLHPGGLSTTKTLLEAARLAPGRRLLDAGCGLGASARLAARTFALRVDACDVSGAALDRARKLSADHGASVRYALGSVLDLSYRDATFDAVLVECVLSTTHAARALREVRRVLKPDGQLLVSDVTAQGATDWPEPLGSILCLSGAWRPGELDDTLARAGFRLERSWDATPAIVALVERIEGRSQLLRSMAGDQTLAAHTVALAEALGLEPSGLLANSSAFTTAREAIRVGGVGYVAAIARRDPAVGQVAR